ncbi:hypothetical protein RIR_jg261.t3 [Rhizophagus irregularis DAOM 181602=DAOM 197198]|uniref:Uncharacterized protein n=1 Tax=Rhizophagus irregularis (strain DAOM 181602 / DAOM 197198 / MUCL 43194) TaxID=747089 RepID=U9UJA9_RHIID|nr:hypothetical protein RIR_jg261.t3 [Rhizophagus irregularis DAOM 181602=DAOM 197198]
MDKICINLIALSWQLDKLDYTLPHLIDPIHNSKIQELVRLKSRLTVIFETLIYVFFILQFMVYLLLYYCYITPATLLIPHYHGGEKYEKYFVENTGSTLFPGGCEEMIIPYITRNSAPYRFLVFKAKLANSAPGGVVTFFSDCEQWNVTWKIAWKADWGSLGVDCEDWGL